MALGKEKQNKIENYAELVSRMQLANKLGMQYGGERDIYEALGYKKTLSFSDYFARYKRQDIAGAIINRPVNKTWKGTIGVISEESTESQFAKIYKTLLKDLKLKTNFIRLDKVTSIGRYGVLFLGFNDVQDTAGLQQEATKGKSTKLLYIQPLDEKSAIIHKYDTNVSSPRFNLPDVYNITFAGSGSEKSMLVHWSRVVHVIGSSLVNDVEGEPVLERVYNRLQDLEKLVGSSAEMFWRGARPGYQGKVDSDYQMGAKMEEDLRTQIDEYENNLRRIIVNEGVELQALQAQVSDPTSHVTVQLQMISAETGIPLRILVGSERGELASSQDKTEWSELIQTRREEYAEPQILIPFIERLIALEILPDVEYEIVWEDLYSPGTKEKAEIGKTRATALKEYTSNPVAEAIVSPYDFFTKFLGFTEPEAEEMVNNPNTGILLESDDLEE